MEASFAETAGSCLNKYEYMNRKEYNAFRKLRNNFRGYVSSISGLEPGAVPVYNEDLDKFNQHCGIRYIVLADNPGKEEAAESRYLVGHAGKQARNFFTVSGLVGEFDSEVMVLNKTCIHTNSTTDLRKLKNGKLLGESQKFMGDLAYEFHRLLSCEIWIVGCSELHSRGIFSLFRETLAARYCGEKNLPLKNRVRCYKHFSYGNFSHDLKLHPSGDINEKLEAVGTEMRLRYLGW